MSWNVIWPYSDIHDSVHPIQHPEKPRHVLFSTTSCLALWAKIYMSSVTLPNIGLRSLDQTQHRALLYMVLSGSTLEWRAPCVPSCLKFYLFYGLFLHLAHVSQFYLVIFVCGFVSYLWPISCASIFILHYFTIKSPVNRGMESDHYHPSEHFSETRPTSYYVHATL